MPGVTDTPLEVPKLTGTLPPHCRQDVDSLRRFVRSVLDEGAPERAVPPAEFREVLLTGATGFLGRFVLRDLLRQNPDLLVHCVVRAKDAEHGFRRLRGALEEADIWDAEHASRIRVVPGDVTSERFGLGEPEFERLCRQIDAVFHFAAEISLSSSYLSIRKANVFSTRNVLELCLRRRYKHFFHASTMGVFPQAFCCYAGEFGESLIEAQAQPDLESMKRMFPIGWLGYPWSKLVSEQALLFAHSAGMPLAIYRFPRTSIASTGYTNADDATIRLLAGIVDVGMMPEGFAIDGSNEAVDVLSRVCTAIAMNPSRRHTIYHCCDPWPDYRDIELSDFGLYYPQVPYPAFRRACMVRGQQSPLHGYWVLIDHFARYWFAKGKTTGRVPVADSSIREDCPEPVRWPSVFAMLKRSGDWIRSRRREWPYVVPKSRLDSDCLTDQARRFAREAGVPFESTYPAWMRRGLEELVRALQDPDAGLLEDKLSDVVFDFSRTLRNTAALADERQCHPEIEAETIDRPVFIVGINRTGTTYLHRLMARDPKFWSLRSYEFMGPVLPPEQYATVAGTPEDPRRAHFDEALDVSGVRETFAGIHHIDIDEPEEDFPILKLAFATWTLAVQYRVPGYARWLAETGCRNAYAHHRRIMQHYTWQRRQRDPGRTGQWLFKMPGHLMELEALHEAYPDALLIQTHREPRQFMGSWNSMVERIRSQSSEPRPRQEFGAEQLDFMSGMLNKATRFRQAHPESQDRWVDVNYYDLIEDPLGIIRNIYDRFDWKLEPDTIDSMERWQMRQMERRRAEVRHRYDLQDFGLTPKMVDEAFAPYLDFITSLGNR